MKLRLQTNSIRLRLKRGEVDQLLKLGRVEEALLMGSSDADHFLYSLESSIEAFSISAQLTGNGIRIVVPIKLVTQWGTGDEVSIEAKLSVGDGVELQVLIEKDFACLNGTNEQNRDTFPNPLAGSKC